MRKFLVVLDDSRECLNAMRFAAMRAAHTGGGVEVLAIIPPEEFNHWIGIGNIMREEARERIHVHYEVFAKWMRDRQHIEPELVIREGIVTRNERHVPYARIQNIDDVIELARFGTKGLYFDSLTHNPAILPFSGQSAQRIR